MTSHPILFSAPMVRAILSGAKTQTRRVVTARNSLVNGSPPLGAWPTLDFSKAWVDRGPSPAGNPGPYLKAPGYDDSAHRVYSRVQAGDVLWVRETHRVNVGGAVDYHADLSKDDQDQERELARLGQQHASELRWKPSIHMPRWACRLELEVTDVRVERLQDISEEDAKAEGVRLLECVSPGDCNSNHCPRHWPANRYTHGFELLWDSIYASSGIGWQANPWVWAISFRRLNGHPL